MKQKILITGAAGFVGFHLTKKLLTYGHNILGIDNLNNYYSKKLKLDRIRQIKENNFKFVKMELKNKSKLNKIFKNFKPQFIFHLAAQAGVRYSLLNPQNYIDNNITVFQNILDLSKQYNITMLIYGSSSSVYGNNKNEILNETCVSDMPISPYGVSKKSNEMMASAYSYLYKLPTLGCRFFTIYGPWGRPDMSLYKFTNKMVNNQKIELFNNGNHKRDFTYIDDAVNALSRSIIKFSNKSKIKRFFKKKNPSLILNISGNKTINLKDYLNLIAKKINKKPKIIFKNLQPGDVIKTTADISKSNQILGYKPETTLSKGITAFISWYKEYYKIK